MSNLIHAVSRVRARESRLLTASHVSRMIEAPSFEEAYSVLDDLGHAEEASRQRESKDFEEVLENSLHETIQIFSQFGLEKVLSVLTVVADIQNFKLAIKSFQKGEEKDEVQPLLISYSSYTPEEVLSLIFDNAGDAELSALLSSVKTEKNNKEMENRLEEVFFARARKIAEKNTFLHLYLDFVQESESLKRDFFSLSADEMMKKYSSGKLSSLVKKGLALKEKEGNFSAIEILFDERNIQFLTENARGQIDGYAPLFAFFWKQERNTRVIRSLLLAKRNGISPEKIRKEFDTFIF
jgi:vacuolar-type H+-ATPase subunit C/Vma6